MIMEAITMIYRASDNDDSNDNDRDRDRDVFGTHALCSYKRRDIKRKCFRNNVLLFSTFMNFIFFYSLFRPWLTYCSQAELRLTSSTATSSTTNMAESW